MADIAAEAAAVEALPPEGAEPEGIQEAETAEAPSGGEATPEAEPGEDSSSVEAGESEAAPSDSPADSEPPQESPKYEVDLGEDRVQVPVEDLVAGYKLSFQAKEDLEEAQRYIEGAQKLHASLVRNPLQTVFEALRDQYQGHPDAHDRALDQLTAIVNEFSARRADLDALPESEKQLRKLQRRNAELEAQRETWEQEQKELESKTQKMQLVNKTLGEISGALKANGLSDVEALQKATAREMLDARKRNQNLTPDAAAKRVKAQLAVELEEKLKGLDGADPKTVQELFPNLIQRLRQSDTAEVKKLRSGRLPPRTNGVKAQAKKQEVTILRDGDWDEIFKS